MVAEALRARYDALIERYEALGDGGDPAVARALLAEATGLVDRALEPRRVAALRYFDAQWSEPDDPVATLAACADVLDLERSDGDDARVTAMRAWCREAIERALDRVDPGSADDAEPAIASLERIAEQLSPNGVYGLARLYEWRTAGDPHADWSRRVALLARHAALRDADSLAFAQAKNLLAVARADEPNADFALAIERRIAAHADVLATLAPGTPLHVETAILLGTAWLDRTDGDLAANGRAAAAVLEPALASAVRRDAPAQVGHAAALLGRAQIFKSRPLAREGLEAGLGLYAQSRAAGAAAGLPALVASADKGIALAWLEALKQGDAAAYEPFLAACGTAMRTFDAMPGHGDEVRKLLQMRAEAAIAAGLPADAIAPLGQAIERVHADLGRATSRAGRLELAWRMRDSAALAAHCHAAAGDARAACLALERGKGLYWASDAGAPPLPPWSGDWTAVVPCDGAVVVPTFAGPDGMAIVAARVGDAAPTVDIVRLEGLGADAVRALVQGDADADAALGGWLLAYHARAARPEAFGDAIERIGGTLGRLALGPIVDRLEARGLGGRCPAEVVWLPQGRAGALPWQAAWTTDVDGTRRWFADRLALRVAPSLAHLQRDARERSLSPLPSPGARAVVIADPTGDLPFAAVEAAWLAEAMPGAEVLAGPAATASALLERLPGARHLHVAGHGRFDVDDPFRSALCLAGGEAVALDTLLLALDQGAPREVVLSACETAVSRVTSIADELLGFPAALLAHGVRAVLASAWPVDDVATAFLMRAWHAARAEPDRPSAAEALRRARVRVRSLTNADVARDLALVSARRGATGSNPADAADAADAGDAADAADEADEADQADVLAARAADAPATFAAAATAATAAEAAAAFSADDPAGRPFARPDAWAAFLLWGDADRLA